MPNPIKDWTSFMSPGLGFNSSNSDIRGQAVTVTPLQSAGGDGQTIFFSCHKTESVDDVFSQVGLSVDASASVGLFGGTDKFAFVHDSNLHSYSVFMVVSIRVSNATEHMFGEELLKEAADLLSSGTEEDNQRFLATFGDFYIKGVESGGEYFAIIEVHTTDQTDQNSISNSLNLAGFFGDGGVALQSTFSSKFIEATSNRTLDITSYQRGGLGEGTKQQVTPGELLDKALNFASEIHDHPTPYRAELQDYISLNPPKPPNTIDIQHAKDVLQQLATDRNILLQFINDVTFILSNPDQFAAPAPGIDLNALANQAREMENTIKHAASSCMDDVRACKLIDVTLPDRRVLPKRNAPPAKIKLPSVVGKLADEAKAILEPLKLEIQEDLTEITVTPGIKGDPPIGQIIEQHPAAETMVDQGSLVTLKEVSKVNYILLPGHF